MKFVFCVVLGIYLIEYLRTQECSAKYDPYITTFDQMLYGFQYSGDHFIMYDDFKNTRVTSGFQECNFGSCACAVYVKKNRKLIFVDFCNVNSYTSPTSKLYAVSVEKMFVGLKAIREVPPCSFISSLDENDQQTWDSIPTILESFKCARLQGSNYYTYYLIRTVEKHFEDSLLVKFLLKNREMPILKIKAPNSANRSTGGLCGRWDGRQDTDLYVLDQDGVESFVSISNLTLIRDFWNLNSIYNKQNSHSKRCVECMLMSERSFYCPCDDFNLFDQENYNLPPERPNYCKVPMHACIEKYYNIKFPIQNISSTSSDFLTSSQLPLHTSTNPNPIKFEEAYDICWTSFMNRPGLNNSLINGCLDRNATIQFCINDVTLSSDASIVNTHIESSKDMIIQNILTNQQNCDVEDILMLCPNNCSGNGVCKFEQRCLLPGLINNNCSYPVKCECEKPFGGNDCSQDLTNIAEFTISPQYCDLRTKNCSQVNGFGYPFSTRDPIYVKIEYTEYDIYNNEHLITERSVADTITDNNILIELYSLSSLNLYKNIHSIKADFISRDSLANVRIYINYSNESFVQWANMTLYDSICRTANQENGQLVFKNERCDIEGVCYVRNQTSESDPNLICNPDESINSWTQIPPDPLCNGKNVWTRWYNFDSPDTDGGDFEFYHDYQYGCRYPSVVQARTVEDIEANQTGQLYWIVPLYGFFCYNRENENGCADYEIRQCCDKSELSIISIATNPSTSENLETTTTPNPTKTSTTTTTKLSTTKENLETSKTSNFVSSNPTKTSTKKTSTTTKQKLTSTKQAKLCQKDGYFPDIKSGCRRYYRCVYTGTEKEQINFFNCPSGTLFDQFNKICNHEVLVKCD